MDFSVVADWDATEGDPAAPVYSDAVKALAVSFAGQSLRMLSGFRVGGCPVTIRPCQQRCTPPTFRAYPTRGVGYYDASTPWWPVNLGGQWLNIACGAHLGGCDCTMIHQLLLPLPCGGITEVKVDGTVLNPSSYRLDQGGRLLRVDGQAWPLCQDMEADDSEVGTYSITYTPGIAPDGLAAAAGALLASEFAKALVAGQECSLPAGVQTIVRGGVTMTLVPGVFPQGRTGIQLVDAWLDRYNPYRLRSAPTVWSPDLAQHRRML